MIKKIVYKKAFAVIGKAGKGSANNPGEWIAPLWQDANSNFAEIGDIVRRDAAGALLVWGAMNDADEQNKRWSEIGKYMAGCEADADAIPPNGWSKWIVPAQTYLVAECTADKYGEVFDAITGDSDVQIISTVHERYPQPGNPSVLELWFPISQGLQLEIRPFTHELIPQYIAFFDGDGQADKPEWQGCRCVHFHWNTTNEADFHAGRSHDEISREIIADGKVTGYLAFFSGKIVGWCNVNDKQNFERLNKTPLIFEDSLPKTKAVVCFLVRPDMRGCGIAGRLLDFAINEAKIGGYSYFEGYPPLECADQYDAHRGSVPFFEKYGFEKIQHENTVIMRRRL